MEQGYCSPTHVAVSTSCTSLMTTFKEASIILPHRIFPDLLSLRYAWAIPDERALRIIGHFGPIVEVGCGLGYWARLLRDRGVDVTAYDRNGGDLGDVSRKADEQGVPNTTATGKESFCSTSGTVKQLNNENSFNNSFWTKVSRVSQVNKVERGCLFNTWYLF
ncbi:unnamed protein product [Choristocarpus tenellus]